MKLSIIIPYYNVKPYTDELLDRLLPQITDEVEVILIDDGSDVPYSTQYEWCQVYRQKNKGVSGARNAGLSFATGEYIAFIDSDDLVADDYVSRILSKIPFDHLEMSWKSLPGGQQFEYQLHSDSDRLSNPSAVTRVFNRSLIGTTRFNENKQAAEDAEFTNIVCRRSQKVAVITDFMYFYRTATPNSLTKRYMSGDTDTKRIVYHYRNITADMTDLLEEVKRENEHNEVYILTERNEIPELAEYAKIMRPGKVRGMELRGEPLPQFIRIKPLEEIQIIIYLSTKHGGGLFTWIYNFCRQMSGMYDITVLHEGMDIELVRKLIEIVDVRQCGDPIRCHTLIMMRIGDAIPPNIRFKRSIQMVHSTHLDEKWTLPADRDIIIPISKTVQKSWNLEHDPILNMTFKDTGTLQLISATRLKTPEKGLTRMKLFVQKLKAAGIRFQWDCYSDVDPQIKGVTYHPMTTDIRRYIRNADYLVQLSDNGEGFCYSIVEALEEGTAVITTPLDVLPEIGFIEGVHGYTFGYDLEGDAERIRDIPQFKYTYDNETIRKQWGSVLGEGQCKNAPVNVRCVKTYRDVILDRQVAEGEVLTLNRRRADEIVAATYGIIV